MSSAAYSVTLHHLSSKASRASLEYADEQILAINLDQLRALLYAFSVTASNLTIYEPSLPEIRVKTDRDVFVIRTRYRRLCLVGWESILRGEDHSVAYILTTITGTAEPAKAAPKVERAAHASSVSRPPIVEKSLFPRWAKIAVMIVLIIGFNGATAWMLLKPAPSLLPPHEGLPVLESHALLNKVAGQYETGTKEGDRRMIIDADGTLRLSKYGPQQVVLQERVKSARGGKVENKPALITSEPGVIIIKDDNTLVYFNTTYTRRQP